MAKRIVLSLRASLRPAQSRARALTSQNAAGHSDAAHVLQVHEVGEPPQVAVALPRDLRPGDGVLSGTSMQLRLQRTSCLLLVS
jgi:hypothetical protein